MYSVPSDVINSKWPSLSVMNIDRNASSIILQSLIMSALAVGVRVTALGSRVTAIRPALASLGSRVTAVPLGLLCCTKMPSLLEQETVASDASCVSYSWFQCLVMSTDWLELDLCAC